MLVLAAAGCNDAVLLVIAGDRPVPQGVDAICIGVADADASGGHFGHAYRLEGELGKLPQTLRLEPGSASSAYAWVRADRGGVPVARAGKRVDFGADVALTLDVCAKGSTGAPAARGAPVGPSGAQLVASLGPGGELVVAVAAGGSAVIDVVDGQPVAAPGPALPAGNVVALVAVDVDGDCADDVIVATDAAPPAIWRRRGTDFVPDDKPLGDAPVAAVAAADVDRDGRVDLVTGAGDGLLLWRNDGSGTFTPADTALTAAGRLASVRALAFGDLDGDGNPDLVVGQGGDPMRAWLGDASGGGTFAPSDGVIAPVPLDVARLALADADGDLDPDLAVALAGAPLRLYVDRDGRLEDQSFVRLPQPAPTAHAIAIAGWDAGCEPDAVIASDAGAPTLRGEPGGTFAADTAAPPATDVVMVDLDDDGITDAVLATPEGVQWLVR